MSRVSSPFPRNLSVLSGKEGMGCTFGGEGGKGSILSGEGGPLHAAQTSFGLHLFLPGAAELLLLLTTWVLSGCLAGEEGFLHAAQHHRGLQKGRLHQEAAPHLRPGYLPLRIATYRYLPSLIVTDAKVRPTSRARPSRWRASTRASVPSSRVRLF